MDTDLLLPIWFPRRRNKLWVPLPVKDDARASRMTRPPACFSQMFSFNWMQLPRPESQFHVCWLVMCPQSSQVTRPRELIAHRSETNCTDEFFQLRTRESCVHSRMLCSVFLASIAIFSDPRAQRRQLAPWKRASVGRWSRQIPPTRNDDNPRRSSTSVGVDEFGSRWHSTSNLPLEWTKEGCVRAGGRLGFEKADGNVHSCRHHPQSTAQFLIHD